MPIDMPDDADFPDIFLSYSRRDNESGMVEALKQCIESSFRQKVGRDLLVFFDTDSIQGMDDWRRTIQNGLRRSRLMLAILSPAYFATRWCRWEWEDFRRYEALRQCLGDGVAPIVFVSPPD